MKWLGVAIVDMDGRSKAHLALLKIRQARDTTTIPSFYSHKVFTLTFSGHTRELVDVNNHQNAGGDATHQVWIGRCLAQCAEKRRFWWDPPSASENPCWRVTG
jgi:hypothetical protein